MFVKYSNMIKTALRFSLLLVLLSCGGSSRDVLPKDQMEKLLWEMTQGSEFLSGYVFSNHPALNQAALNNQMLDRILKINKISKKQLDKSLEYYREHPKQLKVILDTLTARQQRIQDTDTAYFNKPDNTEPKDLPKIPITKL